MASRGAVVARAVGFGAEARSALGARTWEGIVDVADELDAAAIVIGSRGLSRLREIAEGSLSHQIAEHAGRPVLMGPPPNDGYRRAGNPRPTPVPDSKGVNDMKRVLSIVFSICVLGGGATVALADSIPIGPLPAGPIATINVQHGELVALALPQRTGGRVWRIARPVDPRVLRQLSEATVGSSVVLVFRASDTGQTTVSLALTKGDVSPKALESRRYRVRVR